MDDFVDPTGKSLFSNLVTNGHGQCSARAENARPGAARQNFGRARPGPLRCIHILAWPGEQKARPGPMWPINGIDVEVVVFVKSPNQN